MTWRRSFFPAAAWLFVGYLLAVILFGAWVRISHSGDGCGANWPTCHGELLPADPGASTRIEFTHRVTSALCGVFSLLLLGWSWRRHGRGPVTAAAALTLLFIVFEGAIGAGLVLGGLTGDDDSGARAVVIALHLTNTLALTAFAALTAWPSGRSDPPFRFLPRRRAAFATGIALFVITAMTGAVTALGDTLFPMEVSDGGRLVARVLDGVSAGNHFLVRLRAIHPVVATVAAVWLCWLLRPELGNRWARVTLALVLASVAIGAANIALGAPGWMQLVHLGGAQAAWMALILTCASLAPLGYDTGTRPRR